MGVKAVKAALAQDVKHRPEAEPGAKHQTLRPLRPGAAHQCALHPLKKGECALHPGAPGSARLRRRPRAASLRDFWGFG